VIEIDGSLRSGSGSIVRLAAAYAAMTGKPVRVRNARDRRDKPGLRRQHATAVRAVRDLVGGVLEGVAVDSREFAFHPGDDVPAGDYRWDIGSAGSTTALTAALLPVAASRGAGVTLEIQGGLFQDFAPSVFHLQEVVAPLLARMGFAVEYTIVRPGYVPSGNGILRLQAPPAPEMRPLVLAQRGELRRIWGVALASRLAERKVARRMIDAATEVLAEAGLTATIEERNDDTAIQPGAAFALFAEFEGGSRLGADGAGARGRPAEQIGRTVAQELVDTIGSGATVDRFTADQLVVFAALARGDSEFRSPRVTEHVHSAAWLASLFLGAEVATGEDGTIRVIPAGNGGTGH
jgi:RNA 3'-terminal phosphate cyclase (ATP)